MTTSVSTQARRLQRRARRVRRRARAVQRRGSRKLDSLTKALRSEVPGVAEWRRELAAAWVKVMNADRFEGCE